MNNEFWVEVILPICICVVLPVLIVFIVGRVRQNETNRKTEVMLKALENGTPIDPEFFKNPRKEKKARTRKEKLLDNLTGGCITGLIGVATLVYGIWKGIQGGWDNGDKIFVLIAGILLAIGIANLVIYFIGKKMFAKEIELEEKKLTEGE
jgi:preprotein translocase subunit YajC